MGIIQLQQEEEYRAVLCCSCRSVSPGPEDPVVRSSRPYHYVRQCNHRSYIRWFLYTFVLIYVRSYVVVRLFLDSPRISEICGISYLPGRYLVVRYQ